MHKELTNFTKSSQSSRKVHKVHEKSTKSPPSSQRVRKVHKKFIKDLQSSLRLHKVSSFKLSANTSDGGERSGKNEHRIMFPRWQKGFACVGIPYPIYCFWCPPQKIAKTGGAKPKNKYHHWLSSARRCSTFNTFCQACLIPGEPKDFWISQ